MKNCAVGEIGISIGPVLASSEYAVACTRAGITSFELSLYGKDLDMSAESGCEAIRAGAAAAERAGLKLWSGHLPFDKTWDISRLNEEGREWVVERDLVLIRLAASLGAKRAVIHPSSEPIDAAEREARLKVCEKSLKRLAEGAKNAGILLAVECLPRTCLGNSSAEILRLVESAGEGAAVCCDTNHLVTETAADFIRTVGSRIATVHLSDFDGIDEKHWLPGEGVNDWGAIIGGLRATGYAGPWLHELRALESGRPIEPAVIVENWKHLVKNAD